jgi:hypothetical protein
MKADCDKWHMTPYSVKECIPMQVARYWRLKQHLYQLTVDTQTDAEVVETQAVDSSASKPVEVAVKPEAAQPKKLAVVA